MSNVFSFLLLVVMVGLIVGLAVRGADIEDVARRAKLERHLMQIPQEYRP